MSYSDLEARIARMEQGFYAINSRTRNVANAIGQLQQMSSAGIRASEDGAPTGPSTPCGAGGPSFLTCTSSQGTVVGPFNYYASVRQYIGAISFANGSPYTVLSACPGAAGGTMYAVIGFNVTSFSPVVTYTYCGSFNLLANSLPSDLSSFSFGVNSINVVNVVNFSYTCSPINITFDFKFSLSSLGGGLTPQVNLTLTG